MATYIWTLFCTMAFYSMLTPWHQTNECQKPDKFKHLQSLRLKRKQTSFPRTNFGVWRLDLQLRGKTATSQIIRYTLKWENSRMIHCLRWVLVIAWNTRRLQITWLVVIGSFSLPPVLLADFVFFRT